MADKFYNEQDVQNIANSIRNKNGTTNTYKVSEMSTAIDSLKTGGVDSVNGKTGEVVLTASDLGAVTDVNGKTGSVTLTPENIGTVVFIDLSQDSSDSSKYYLPEGVTVTSVLGLVDAGHVVYLRSHNYYIYSLVSQSTRSGHLLFWRAQGLNELESMSLDTMYNYVRKEYTHLGTILEDGRLPGIEDCSDITDATPKSYVDLHDISVIPVKRTVPGGTALEAVSSQDPSKLKDLLNSPRFAALSLVSLTDSGAVDTTQDTYFFYLTMVDPYEKSLYFTSFDEGYFLYRIEFHVTGANQHTFNLSSTYLASQSSRIRTQINAKSNNGGTTLLSDLSTLNHEESASVDAIQNKNIYVEVLPKTGSALIGTTIPIVALDTTNKRYQLTDEANYVSFNMKITSTTSMSATLSVTLATKSQTSAKITQVIALP